MHSTRQLKSLTEFTFRILLLRMLECLECLESCKDHVNVSWAKVHTSSFDQDRCGTQSSGAEQAKQSHDLRVASVHDRPNILIPTTFDLVRLSCQDGNPPATNKMLQKNCQICQNSSNLTD